MNEEVTTPAGDAAPAVENVTDKVEGQQQPEADADAASNPAQPKEPKKVDPRQKKIAELSYQTREQQRRIDQLLGMVEKTISQPRQSDDSAPKLESFNTLEEFLEARDKHREKHRTAEKLNNAPDPRYIQAVENARADLYSAGAEKFDDFEEVVGGDVKITTVMRDAIFELDDFDVQAEVAYWLGKNPKESARISKLSPMRQVAEIGKLEDRLTSKPNPTKRPSSLPDPIKPVGGATTKTNKLAAEDSVAEHIRKRRAGMKFSQ